MDIPKFLVAGLLSFFLFFASADAQYAQQLRGQVVEQLLQAPVTDATVTLVPLQFSVDVVSKSVITDANGNFKFPAVPIGQYKLQVSHIGFKTASIENIVVN